MSNTTITPSIGSATTGSAALSLILGTVLAPAAQALNVAGVIPFESPTGTQAASGDAGASVTVVWSNIGNGAVGWPTQSRLITRAVIEVTGTFASASVAILGSVYGVNFYTVSASSLTSAGFFAALNAYPRFLQPSVTGGGTGTNLTITAVLS